MPKLLKFNLVIGLLTVFFKVSFADDVDIFYLQQPKRVLGYEQLAPFKLDLAEGQSAETYNVLISYQKPGNFNLIDPELEYSKKRELIPNADQVLVGFWDLFLSRANELKVIPGSNSNFKSVDDDQFKRSELYDRNNLEYNFAIPNRSSVQSYLIERMGIRAFEAAEIYQAAQYGYVQNGLAGAKLAFDDYFIRQLDNRVIWFSHRVLEFIETKEMEALIAFGDLNKELVAEKALEAFAERLTNDFFSKTDTAISIYIAEMIQNSKIEYTNRTVVRDFIISTFRPMLSSDRDNIAHISMGKNGRMFRGIVTEKENGGRIASGPKALQKALNDGFFEIIRMQLYMGINFSRAYRFAQFITTSHAHVRSYLDDYRKNQYRGVYQWLVSDFSESRQSQLGSAVRAKSCSAMLSKNSAFN